MFEKEAGYIAEPQKEILDISNKEDLDGIDGSSYETVSLERLLQNGATYLKLSNYSLANDVYATVVKKYPEDYRGWWGLIVCKTKNFSDVIFDQTESNVWLSYIKQLAHPKEFQELEDQYVDYTKKVSQLAAEEDMNADREKEWRKREDEEDCDRIRRYKESISWGIEVRSERGCKKLCVCGEIIFSDMRTTGGRSLCCTRNTHEAVSSRFSLRMSFSV